MVVGQFESSGALIALSPPSTRSVARDVGALLCGELRRPSAPALLPTESTRSRLTILQRGRLVRRSLADNAGSEPIQISGSFAHCADGA
jgi:hypothetical protein